MSKLKQIWGDRDNITFKDEWETGDREQEERFCGDMPRQNRQMICTLLGVEQCTKRDSIGWNQLRISDCAYGVRDHLARLRNAI